MKQKLVSFILLLFYTGIVIYPAVPLLDYAINYHYYAKVVCVNKDKPQMHCNGQCHLKKEIKKIYDEKSLPAKKKSILPVLKLKEYTLYNLSLKKNIYQKKQVLFDPSTGFKNLSLCKGYRPPQFRPPPV